MFLTKTSISFQPENSYVWKKSTGTRGKSVGSTRHEPETLCQTTDSTGLMSPSIIVESSFKFLKMVDI
jgi:hypothetical protein